MTTRTAVEVKAFVPAKDFELSKRFYVDLGFRLASSSDGVAYLHHGDCSFLLQDFYVPAHADNFMMHLLVEDLDPWWEHVQSGGLCTRYGVKSVPPKVQPWRMRDFILFDPTGVLWRIAQNI